MTKPENTSCKKERIILPLPPLQLSEGEIHALYARFMRHLRCVPNSRMEIKMLSAIQFTADILGHSDAHVAKSLVDLGLRAPRMAFPADFLKFVDQALMRTGWDVGRASEHIKALKAHWDKIGEEKFAFVNGEYSLIGEGAFL